MPANRITAWLAAALSCASFQARAEQALGNDALRSEVTGSTVQIDAPLGYKIPMQFREDGTVDGTAGGLAFYLGSATDQGRWWIANGKLCTRWKQWFDQEDNCIVIRRQGRGDEFAWVNDKGKSGTGRVVERRPVAVASAPKGALATDKRGWVASANIGREARAVPAPAKPVEQQSQFAAPVQMKSLVGVPAAAAPVSEQPTARAALGGSAIAEKPASAVPVPRKPAVTQDATVQPSQQPVKQIATAAKQSPAKSLSGVKTAAKPEPRRVFRVVNVEDDDELFVRTQPSSDAQIVGAIPPDGRGVVALGPCQNSWCPVSFEGRTGWAHGAYLVADGG